MLDRGEDNAAAWQGVDDFDEAIKRSGGAGLGGLLGAGCLPVALRLRSVRQCGSSLISSAIHIVACAEKMGQTA
jgi:hypothetical protein